MSVKYVAHCRTIASDISVEPIFEYEMTLSSLKLPTHQPPRQRMDTQIDGYATAHPTVRSPRLRETFFTMCRAVCLELELCAAAPPFC